VRIALDATYSVDPQPSGIAIYSREILCGLAAAHPEIAFLHCYRPKQFRRAPRSPFRNVHRRLLQPPLPTFRADLFHALNQRLDTRPAGRTVTTFHDLFVMTGEYSSAEFRSRFAEHARRAAGNSDLIITVSEFTAGQVNSLLGFDRSRIRVIPHGVHVPKIAVAAERRKSILFVGALQVRKNVAALVEAFEEVPEDWRLILAGAPTGFGAADILKRIEQSRCRERIEITGYVSEERLQQLYGQASIFAFPSLDEGFGIPVLEAMAYGVPVITSNGSALTEVAGDAALLIDPREREELAGALLRLIENPELRRELADAGRRRVKDFSWDRSLRETFAVYRELTG
jgi:glycosyltransferase involved in cell wall biosynthesis